MVYLLTMLHFAAVHTSDVLSQKDFELRIKSDLREKISTASKGRLTVSELRVQGRSKKFWKDGGLEWRGRLPTRPGKHLRILKVSTHRGDSRSYRVEIWTRRHQPTLMVRRGDPVWVIAELPGVRIRSKAIAQTSGAFGDAITVMTKREPRMLRATIRSQSEVEVLQ